MTQRLRIDGCYIGTIKRYYQNRDRQSWIFVLDTIDTVNEKYQLQVEIKFEAIRSFCSSGDLSITTWAAMPTT